MDRGEMGRPARTDDDGGDPTLNDVDRELFGFSSSDGEWLELVRTYASEESLGGIGPYEILEEVGRGSQGVVYRGRQPGIGRRIALKRLIAGGFSSESTRARFQREMEAAASLNHPGIVTVHGFEIVDGLPLMAMEWVDGEPITRWARPPAADPARNGNGRIAERGSAEGSPVAPRDPRECLAVFIELCDAVRHAHRNGVLHRDLKPSNVLVSADGRPHVLDFGLAKRLAPEGDVTMSCEFVGTLAYASPEQFGSDRLDVRSDVYSLGVILYEMLTGARPYRPEDGIGDFLAALDRGTFTRPSALRADLDSELDWVLAKALAAQRDERYQTVDSMAEDVRRYLSGEPVYAHPPSVLYELGKLVSRNRTVSALAAVLVLGSVAGTLFFARQASVIAQRAEEVAVARDAEAEARARAEDALATEAEQRRLMQLAWRETYTTLAFLRDDVFLATDPRHSGPETTLRETLDRASRRIGRLGSSPIIQAFVRRTVGEIQWRLGMYAEAEEQLLASLETGRSREAPLTTAEAEAILGGMYLELGRVEEAEELLVQSLVTLETDPERDQTSHWRALEYLTDLYLADGRLDEAEALIDDMDLVGDRVNDEMPGFRCAARVQRGRLLLARGEVEAAVAWLEASLEPCRLDVGEDAHEVGELMAALGRGRLSLGRADEAEAAVRESVAILETTLREGHPEVDAARELHARTLEARR